jgi:hypothetical protein
MYGYSKFSDADLKECGASVKDAVEPFVSDKVFA